MKDQARDLLRDGLAASLTVAQHQIARLYGFASWPRLKAEVETRALEGTLKQAIDREDLEVVKAMMTSHPKLHQARLGYRGDGPLTWVAECRIPSGPPSPTRLAMARWMIENGSNVHQGGDSPLMRASLNADRIPMMDLLVSCGADVNARWRGSSPPMLHTACEALAPEVIAWLLARGVDPNAGPVPALDYLLGGYVRAPARLRAAIRHLRAAGGRTRYDMPGVLDTIMDATDALGALIGADPGLVHRRYPDLEIGASGARRMVLAGATPLHVAAESAPSMRPDCFWPEARRSTLGPRSTRTAQAARPRSFTPRPSSATRACPWCACSSTMAPTRRSARGCPATMSGWTRSSRVRP